MYITIGRNPQSDIVITGYDNVSYDHATIEYENGMFLFIDDSSNGTIVNGEKINHESRPVREGDPVLLAGSCPLEWNQVMAKVNMMSQSSAPLDMEGSRTTMLHNQQAAQQPAYQQPVYQQPAYQQPVYGQQPAYQQPQNVPPQQNNYSGSNNVGKESAAVATNSGLSILVFVAGLAAIGLALYPFIDYLSIGGGKAIEYFPLYVLGMGRLWFLIASVVLGITSLVIDHFNKNKTTLSKIGKVLGIIGLALGAVSLLWSLSVKGQFKI